jgi:choline-sulfatase
MPSFADFINKPNILFINFDQQRHDYLGYRGAEFVSTPNLDKLAARSKVFTHCHSTSPVCAPARIGLASGLRPHRLGSLNNNSFLPAGQPTYYQQLRNHGYRVGCVGKLDLAKPDGFNSVTGDRPCTYAWGFTDPYECEGKMHAGRTSSDKPFGPYTKYLHDKGLLEAFYDDYIGRFSGDAPDCWYRDSVLPTEDFEDLFIGRHAAEWVRNAPTDYPWHYFVTFVGPHDPFDPPTEYADRYRNAEMPPRIEDSLENKPRRHQHRAKKHTPEQVLGQRRQYCAAITALDDAVGWILEALEASGQAENTYVIFSADHGEMLCDHQQTTKDIAYEASWRVPLTVAGPGIQPGESDTLVEWIDLHPTICDLAGVPTLEGLDARSIAPVLRGSSETHREFVATFMKEFHALRTHKWKYVETINDKPELYNMLEDPDELTNLVDQQPPEYWEMRNLLNQTLSEGGVTRGGVH